MPLLKRLFDIIVVILAIPLWIPAMIITALAILVTSGMPVIYVSKRYVRKNTNKTVVKFRTMVKNAEQLANRDTIEPEPERLLNLEINPNLYTPIGLFLEKLYFTELPQLVQVLLGTLTLVGNRPMPENMLNSGRSAYPYLDERFCIASGITGPAQLVGRENLKDTERLELEITYCYICQEAYNPLLDLKVLLITVFLPLGFFKNISQQGIKDLMMNCVAKDKRAAILDRVQATLNT